MMKSLVLIIVIAFFGHEAITSSTSTNKESENSSVQNSCPPFDDASGNILLMFLTSDRYIENRQEVGIKTAEDVNPEDVVLRDESGNTSICKKLKEHFPWPKEHYSISYFKIDNQYFVVNALKVNKPEDEGKINIHTGNSYMIVLDEELTRIGYFLN